MVRLQKRLLLAVDGSDRALQTVSYAGQEAAFRGMKIVLFHVSSPVPDAFYDLERKPMNERVVRQVRAWEAQRRESIRLHMDTARQMLLEAGLVEQAIEIKIQERQYGIARDIMAEIGRGYDALLIRRRGNSHMREVVLGSIAQKLLHKMDAIPLLIAGTKPANKKILICVDGSPGAYRAVQFVGEMLGSLPDYHFRLIHVIRSAGAGMEATIHEGLEGAGAIFDKSIEILSSAGIEPAQISTKPITGVRSRAGWIVEHARIGWSTIVVGRRGVSNVGIFHMGRVSSKIVFAGRRENLWIVN